LHEIDFKNVLEFCEKTVLLEKTKNYEKIRNETEKFCIFLGSIGDRCHQGTSYIPSDTK